MPNLEGATKKPVNLSLNEALVQESRARVLWQPVSQG
jgi:hypothetical protein